MKAAGKKNQEEHNLLIKNEPVTPNLAAQNRGFVWVPAVPSVTFGTALLHAAAPGPTSWSFRCSVPHTSADIHTPTVTAEGDPVRLGV